MNTPPPSSNPPEEKNETTTPQPSSEWEQKIQELEENKKVLQDKYLRLVAEFDNYKKRTQKQMLELIQTANKDVVLAILDIVDDMERAEKQSADEEGFKKGTYLIFEKMRRTLQQIGVEKLKALNEEFNTDLHEAVTELSVQKEEQKNKVVDVVQEGYLLSGKLIRYAKVVVGK